MRSSISLNEMETYFKNNPCKRAPDSEAATLSLINGFQVFFEYSAPDENNDVSLQLKVSAEHDQLPENVEAIHVMAVLAAHVLGSLGSVLALANINKE